jgi:uncharacterized membrane protein
MRSSKWLILALVLSVGINVALIGYFAGRASHGGHPRNLDPTIGFMRVLPNLPDARRRELRPLARKHLREIVPSLRQMRGAQQRLSRVLLAEPFDARALEEVLEAIRQHMATSQVTSHAAFVNLASRLTPAERRLLVDIMQRPPQRRPGRPADVPPGDVKMLGPPPMEPTGANHSSARRIRNPIPGSLPAAHSEFRF